MLILSRKPGQRIFVGKDIVITILGGYGNNLRIGIDAPASIPVHREEVARRIEEAQQQKDQPHD